jgi:hypothetical protein
VKEWGRESAKGLKHPKADTIKFKKSDRKCKFRERVMRRLQIKSLE